MHGNPKTTVLCLKAFTIHETLEHMMRVKILIKYVFLVSLWKAFLDCGEYHIVIYN